MVRFGVCRSTLTFVIFWLGTSGAICPDMCRCDGDLFVSCNNANITDDDLPGLLATISPGVAYLDLCYNKLSWIPEQTFATFPQLLVLDLSHNELNLISGRSFKGLHNIQKIRLNHNKIQTLINDSFSYVSTLEELYLNDNGLNEVEVDALRGLGRLNQLDLSNNQLTQVAGLHNLNTLKFLDLSHNVLQSLPDNGFFSLSRLEMLNLNHNALESLSSRAFSGLVTLSELKMDSNNLTEIMRDNIDPIRATIKTFSVSRNRIQTVGSDVFRQAGMLRNLDLSYNQISDIQRAAFGGLNLHLLYLHGNRLKEVTSAMMSGCRKIEHLDLSDNAIVDLNTHSFDNCRQSLYHILLNENDITDILKGAFNGMIYLQALNLANNSISYIEDDAFSDLDDVKTVDLSWNRIGAISKSTIRGMRALKNLSVQYNPLIRFEYLELDSQTSALTIDMNLTATDITSTSVTVKWPYQHGSQIYWSRFVHCLSSDHCPFRPQAEFLAPYEEELVLSNLHPDSVYYVCVNPAFKSPSVKLQQCLYIRTNKLVTTLRPETSTQASVSGKSKLQPCAISFCIQILFLLFLHVGSL